MEYKRCTSFTTTTGVEVSSRRPTSLGTTAVSGRCVQRINSGSPQSPSGKSGRCVDLHGGSSCTALSGRGKPHVVKSSDRVYSSCSGDSNAERINCNKVGNSGRTFQRTNSAIGRQKGEKIRQNHRLAVYCRVRAFQQEERTGKAAELAVQMKEGTVEVAIPNKGQFLFSLDGCFWSCANRESPHHQRAATQEDVFDEVGRPLVENVLAGYNASLMTYGQTGSGKTYTTYGPVGSLGTGEEGIVPRACHMIFSRAAVSEQKGVHYTVKASMVEVYLEEVLDLLNNRSRLSLRSNVNRNASFFVNAKKVVVEDYQDVLELLSKAEGCRTYADTKIHDHSSRAHTLFTLEVQTDFEDPEVKPWCGRLVIADLAGSERIREAGTEEGIGFEQARNINLSLLHLGSCFEAVALRGGKFSNASIPEFRNCTLTKLLKDYLGGNSVSVMVVTIAPSSKDANLSVQALRFGDRAQQITTNARLNLMLGEDADDDAEAAGAQEEYAVKKEALYAEFHLKKAVRKLVGELRALEEERKECGNDGKEHAEALDKKIQEGEKALEDLEYQLLCQRKILYGPVLQLEDTVCELQMALQKSRLDHEEEIERQQVELEQRMINFKEGQQVIMTQHESTMAEERMRHRQSLEEAKDEIAALRQLVVSLQNDKQRLEKELEELSTFSRTREKELWEKLQSIQQVLDETNAARREDEEGWGMRLKEQEALVQQHIDAHAETSALLEEKTRELQESQDQVCNTESVLKDVQQELADTQGVLGEATEALAEMEAEKEALQEKLTEKEASLEEAIRASKEHQALQEETHQQLFLAEGAVEEITHALEEMRSAKEELQEQLSETEATLEETTRTLMESEALKMEMEEKLSEKETTMEAVYRELESTKATLEETQQQLKEMEVVVEETSTALVEREGVLQSVASELAEVKEVHENTQQRLKETSALLEDEQKKVSEMEAAVEEVSRALEETEALQQETYQKLSATEAIVDESKAELADTERQRQELEVNLKEMKAVLQETNSELEEAKAVQEATQVSLEETVMALEKAEEAHQDLVAQQQETDVVVENIQRHLVEKEQDFLAQTAFMESTEKMFRSSFDLMMEGLSSKMKNGVSDIFEEVLDWVASMKELVAQHEVIRKVLRNINEEAKVVDKPCEVRTRLSRVSTNS